jgi:cytoskeletal protein CcmA (bactofilin family)
MSESVIGEDLTIIGNVTSKGNLKLDGKLKGDMHCASLVVSEKGRIDGGIIANNEVVVFGNVTGSIRGRRVMLHSTARVEGDIFHQGIGIEMGTRYDGTLKWTEDASAFAFKTDVKPGATSAPQQAAPAAGMQQADQKDGSGRGLLRR